jgi:hypothetical protein
MGIENGKGELLELYAYVKDLVFSLARAMARKALRFDVRPLE